MSIENKDRRLPEWYGETKAFQKRSYRKGTIQIAATIIPYTALWAAMILMLRSGITYAAVFPLAVATAFFMVRIFILFHDCCHGSFMPNIKVNRIIGYIFGILIFTPFESWRRAHLKHHATNGQLDHRGSGDVWTMTYEEYRGASNFRRFIYRFYRNPIVLFIFGPVVHFVLLNRISGIQRNLRERISVTITNIGITGVAVALSVAFGFKTYLLIQLPIIWIGTTIGVWLFYVQHQFTPGYWARDGEWTSFDAAMRGASYYRLPRLFAWLTGNIGIHHLHHLRPGIPNYMLQKALAATPQAHAIQPLTLRASLSSLRLKLWHETERRFVGFRQAHSLIQNES